MDIFGIGIDIVDLERVNKIYLKYGDKFAEKILNEKELVKFNQSRNKTSFLGKRFAVKEAVGKALGIGILNGNLLKNIFVDHDKYGKPIVKFSKKKEFKFYSNKIIHVSIADEKKFAIANALILSK